MTLGEKQEEFLIYEIFLLDKATELGAKRGFGVRGGDGFRDPRVHGAYGVKVGYSSAYSMHKLKLARDLNFVRDGVLIHDSEEFRELAEWWLQQHVLARWGGISDGNHFSFTHDGRW